MERIDAFLKKDSDILRNIILLLFGLIFGISQLIYDHRVSAIFMGLFCVIGSIFLFLDIIKEFKQINSVNAETTNVEEDVKRKGNKIFSIVLSLLVTIVGLYFLLYKNDEAMVFIIPLVNYLILRDSFKN